MIKNLVLGIIVILLMVASTLIWARYTSPLLVLDMRNSPELPKHFRTTSDSIGDELNAEGLSQLEIAGGGEFSKSAFEQILFRLQAKKIVVIDLRQESHGLLNGNAISWYGLHNAANAGKSSTQIEEDQSNRLVDLGEQELAVVNKILKKSFDGEIKKVKTVEYLVHQTSTEEEFVTGIGQKYQRLYVQDYHAPSPKEVDRFIRIVKALPKNKWIYFHCREGVGRTTTFMVMYDMIRNAKKVSFADILARQMALSGKDLTKMPDKNNFKYQLAVDRLDFIKKFYEYARNNQDNYHTSWSQWLQ
ncbi:MAG: hypothetical protein KIT56_02150 [Gammaproteobacteria bacterium]|nr:hypothetical protein [Gammaproteobacteria bacterium]MCW5582683.1 hypothetical protein [Gammaproteobacteria bacterium]